MISLSNQFKLNKKLSPSNAKYPITGNLKLEEQLARGLTYMMSTDNHTKKLTNEIFILVMTDMKDNPFYLSYIRDYQTAYILPSESPDAKFIDRFYHSVDNQFPPYHFVNNLSNDNYKTIVGLDISLLSKPINEIISEFKMALDTQLEHPQSGYSFEDQFFYQNADELNGDEMRLAHNIYSDIVKHHDNNYPVNSHRITRVKSSNRPSRRQVNNDFISSGNVTRRVQSKDVSHQVIVLNDTSKSVKIPTINSVKKAIQIAMTAYEGNLNVVYGEFTAKLRFLENVDNSMSPTQIEESLYSHPLARGQTSIRNAIKGLSQSMEVLPDTNIIIISDFKDQSINKKTGEAIRNGEYTLIGNTLDAENDLINFRNQIRNFNKKVNIEFI